VSPMMGHADGRMLERVYEGASSRAAKGGIGSGALSRSRTRDMRIFGQKSGWPKPKDSRKKR
jgi:hypothetical protein